LSLGKTALNEVGLLLRKSLLGGSCDGGLRPGNLFRQKEILTESHYVAAHPRIDCIHRVLTSRCREGVDVLLKVLDRDVFARAPHTSGISALCEERGASIGTKGNAKRRCKLRLQVVAVFRGGRDPHEFAHAVLELRRVDDRMVDEP